MFYACIYMYMYIYNVYVCMYVCMDVCMYVMFTIKYFIHTTKKTLNSHPFGECHISPSPPQWLQWLSSPHFAQGPVGTQGWEFAEPQMNKWFLGKYVVLCNGMQWCAMLCNGV